MVHRAVVRRHNSIGSFLSDGCLLIPFQFVGTNYLWGPGAASGATVAMHQNQWCSATYKTLLQRCSSRPVFFNALHFSFLLPVPALSGGRRPLLGVTAVTAVYSGPSRRGGGRWRPGATCSHGHTRTGGIMQHRNISGKRKLARIGIVVDMMPTIQIAKKPLNSIPIHMYSMISKLKRNRSNWPFYFLGILLEPNIF